MCIYELALRQGGGFARHAGAEYRLKPAVLCGTIDDVAVAVQHNDLPCAPVIGVPPVRAIERSG